MKKNIFKLGLVAILTVLPFLGQQTLAQVPAACGDVMLQAFDYYPQPIDLGGTKLTWNDSKWTTLNNQATEIGTYFQMVWLPPSARGEGHPTTMGYHPQYYFNQNSTFGTDTELKTLIASLKTNNCKAIADIVVNHRSSPTDWCTFATETYKGVTYTPNSSWICSDDESKSQAPAGCNNPTGGNDTGELYPAARDLSHSNSAVRDNIKAYMQYLKDDIGYSGWRYDVAKGFGQSYIAEYNAAAAGTFSVGEVMEQDYTYCKNWVINTGYKSTVFDFPAQTGLREALNNSGSPDYTKLVSYGQPRGLIAAEMKKYAVTFVENHDTYRYNLGFYGNIEVANAFILSSPGIPCIYLPHWNKYKTNISKMINARKKAGLHSESVVTNIQSATNIYVAKATGTNGELIVKLGSGSYSAPAGYTLECSGTDWAIWTSAISGPTVYISPVGGYYANGTDVTLSSTGGTAPVKIYYTTNGTTPTASSTLYNGSFPVTNAKVKAIAIDNSSVSSAVKEETYTNVKPAGITVSFTAPTSWTKVGCYVWTGTNTELAGAWPGADVTASKVGNTFSYTVTNTSVLPLKVIFNNYNTPISGNTEQTVDLSTSKDICWMYGTSTVASNVKKYTANEVACTSGIGEVSETKASITIYPNPARETLTVESDLNLSEIQIYSISGVLVESVIVSSNKEVISLEKLAPGYYNVVAITEEGARTASKLIKQ